MRLSKDESRRAARLVWSRPLAFSSSSLMTLAKPFRAAWSGRRAQWRCQAARQARPPPGRPSHFALCAFPTATTCPVQSGLRGGRRARRNVRPAPAACERHGRQEAHAQADFWGFPIACRCRRMNRWCSGPSDSPEAEEAHGRPLGRDSIQVDVAARKQQGCVAVLVAAVDKFPQRIASHRPLKRLGVLEQAQHHARMPCTVEKREQGASTWLLWTRR